MSLHNAPQGCQKLKAKTTHSFKGKLRYTAVTHVAGCAFVTFHNTYLNLAVAHLFFGKEAVCVTCTFTLSILHFIFYYWA
jgi:hypothetical protein